MVVSPRITRRALLAATAAATAERVTRPGSALARLLGGTPPRASSGLPLVASGLAAGPGQPPIIARSAWARGDAPPKVAPAYATVQLAFVHHTENPDGYTAAEVPAMLRSIYRFHRYTHGWNDIGYNFVIDRFGRIFEARAGGIDEPVVGAQAGGYNAYSTGIAVLGTYSAQRISPPARTALAHLLAWKLSLHGAPARGRVTVRVTPGGAIYSRYPANTPVSLPRIAGHRDADSTDCPGDALYGELPALRRTVARLSGTPAHATLQMHPPEAAGAPPTLAGALQLLDGTPLANAPIEIQARHIARRGEIVTETTLAQTLTAPDGHFSLPFSLSPGASGGAPTALRALCRGSPHIPAAVSDPLIIPGSVSFSPPPSAAQPSPPPTGQPSPPSAGQAPPSPTGQAHPPSAGQVPPPNPSEAPPPAP
jgi:hypothetical protein